PSNEAAAEINGFIPCRSRSAHRPSSRAVSRNRSSRYAYVFVVRSDGFDHEIEFAGGAVDFPEDAVVLAWPDGLGFCEVIEPVNPSRRVIFHDEHNTASAFFPREQNEAIGADVEHEKRKQDLEAGAEAPAPHGQLRCGVSRPAPRRGLS